MIAAPLSVLGSSYGRAPRPIRRARAVMLRVIRHPRLTENEGLELAQLPRRYAVAESRHSSGRERAVIDDAREDRVDPGRYLPQVRKGADPADGIRPVAVVAALLRV